MAGILLSNEEICETVDKIQIATRVEMKEKPNHQNAVKKVQRPDVEQLSKPTTGLGKCWYRKFYMFDMLNRLKRRVRPQWRTFSLWTIPNYFIERSTNLLYRKFIINSDCDVIYK